MGSNVGRPLVESVPPAPAHQSPPPRELTSVRLSSVPRRHHSYSAGIPPFLAVDFEKEARKGIGCVMASRRRRETKLGHLPDRGRAGARLPLVRSRCCSLLPLRLSCLAMHARKMTHSSLAASLKPISTKGWWSFLQRDIRQKSNSRTSKDLDAPS